MRLRHLLASGALSLAALLVPASAHAAEVVDCGGADLVEQVTPAGRIDGSTTRFVYGDALATFTHDDAAATITWAAEPGVAVERIVVEAGRRSFAFEAPAATVVLDTSNEVSRVTFCGTRPAVTGDGELGEVSLGEAVVVEVGEAIVIERTVDAPTAAPAPAPEADEVAPAPAAPTAPDAAVEAIEAIEAPVEEPAPAPAPVAAPVVVAPAPAVEPEDAPAPADDDAETAPTALALPRGIDGPAGTTATDLTSATADAADAPATDQAMPAFLAFERAVPVATEVGPTPLPVGTMEFVVLTCLGMVLFSSTARLPRMAARRR